MHSFVFSALLLLTAPLGAGWEGDGTLAVAPHHYTFLAGSPNGDLLAVTFNEGAQKADIPALLIRSPESPKPEVVELCRVTFEGFRGFGGVAVDDKGDFYVSGDTGRPFDSFVRKFKADGTPDTTFGKAGEIRPGRRCLGLDTFSGQLYVAHDWLDIQLYETARGTRTGRLPIPMIQGDKQGGLRDIAVDPRDYAVYGVAKGGVMVWAGGSPTSPVTYTYRVISPGTDKPMVGEGIGIDPQTRQVFIAPPHGSALVSVNAFGTRVSYPIPTATAASSLTDVTVAFSGAYVFISDYATRQIHRMRQTGGARTPTSATIVRAAAPVAPAAARTEWLRDHETAIRTARERGEPLLLYFRSNTEKCKALEKQYLLTPEFDRVSSLWTRAFIDASANPLLAQRLGVRRAPTILLLTTTGDTAAEFSMEIDRAALEKVLAQ